MSSIADMTPVEKKPKERVVVAAVSGGPDSVYLLLGKLAREKGPRVVIGHVNYGTRGRASEKDQEYVENLGKTHRYATVIHSRNTGIGGVRSKRPSGTRGNFPARFEERAREIRYRFLKDLAADVGAESIALAHTADDQVETILMRIFEGAGIGGLKGIPRESGDGIVRPILGVWKEEILDYLKKRRIPYRTDRSNVDTRFERNWIRHVLVPLLEKRYGKSVKKRIFTLGERFRELDDYLEGEAGRWIRRNVKSVISARSAWSRRAKGEIGAEETEGVAIPRKPFSALPSALRVKILQRICFDRIGVAPNERLLKAMDRNVCDGGPSARVNAGRGWILANRYEVALFLPGENDGDRKSAVSGIGNGSAVEINDPGEYKILLGRGSGSVSIALETAGKRTPAQAKRIAVKGNVEVFDADGLALPLSVRPLRAGDRIRPFAGIPGGGAPGGEKKVKEILIARKVPREERWGRPVVCDAEGAILWIPGVLRSAIAPVTPGTRKAAILRIRSMK